MTTRVSARKRGSSELKSGVATAPSDAASLPRADDDDGLTRRVLLAEDDPKIGEALTKALEKSGYRVDHVDAGTQILQKASEAQPDAIVLKQWLCRTDGRAVASVLNVMPRTRSIPVVLYGANGGADGVVEDRFLRLAPAVLKQIGSNETGKVVDAVEEVLSVALPRWLGGD